MLDNIALFKENVLQYHAPFRRLAQKEFEIHAKVLELFMLGIPHDCLRLAIPFDGDALLVPIDCLRLFNQRTMRRAKRYASCPTVHCTNMKPLDWADEFDLGLYRHIIETVNSQLEKMGVERLYARTNRGFMLKIFASMIALACTNLNQQSK